MLRSSFVILFAFFVFASGPVFAASQAPHQAVYNLSLKSATPGSGISGASGTMVYKFNDTCDGWTIETESHLGMSVGEGNVVNTTWSLVAWESKDGKSYRFNVRQTRNGKITDVISGTASLDGPGLGGTAEFTEPEATTVKLPKGTLFPTAHTIALLERAAAGKRVVPFTVFDGSDLDNPFEINAVIGQPLAAGSPGELKKEPLIADRSWPMRLAFFSLQGNSAEPTFEVSLRYHENGVQQQMIQDFGTFSLNVGLQEIKALPKPDC